MRPEGRGELESLYFKYPEFTVTKVPELLGTGVRHPVVIVGAGPVGLTAALTLASYGVRSVLLEKNATFNDGSRAICIARPSCHILERIGAIEPFLEKALGWRRGRSYFAGREIFKFEMPHTEHEKYLPMYNLQQQYIEQYLSDAATRSDFIEIRWASEVTGVESDNDGTSLQVSTSLGDYELEADYVLAADGARSALRSKLGLRLQGQNFEGRYVIADVRMQHDYPTERRALFAPESNPQGTVLVHKQPDDIWRIDYQLLAGEDPDAAIEEATIRERVGAILCDIGHAGPWDLEWWSIYTANTLCLDDYQHGNVFFIGDSAHIVPIFGVRGLNNGLADAYNIGWKLGYVIGGAADSRLLDTYSPERRGATLDVFTNASKSARFMTPPTRGAALVRDAVLSLALRHEFVRPFINPRQMVAYSYSEHQPERVRQLDAEFSGGPRVGSACPNARVGGDRYLLDLAGLGFYGIYFCDTNSTDTVASLFEKLKILDPHFTGLFVSEDSACENFVTVYDLNGDVAQIFDARPGTVYLVRPDLHIAGRWRQVRMDEVIEVLEKKLEGKMR